MRTNILTNYLECFTSVSLVLQETRLRWKRAGWGETWARDLKHAYIWEDSINYFCRFIRKIIILFNLEFWM